MTWGDFPSGHFYSPVPDEKTRLQKPNFKNSFSDYLRFLNISKSEFSLIASSIQMYAAPFIDQMKKGKTAYQLGQNKSFCPKDAIFLAGMINVIKPNLIIEVGGGESTTIMYESMAINNNICKIEVIEPFPEYLLSLTRNKKYKDEIKINSSKVQDVPLKHFKKLKEGDLLFIDSTHVLKYNSDVVYLYNYVLPHLNSGVWVHIHDILYPFEYPQDWLKEKIYWNEAYLVQSMISFSNRYRTVFFPGLYDAFRGKFSKIEWPNEYFSGGAPGSLYLQIL
jgi:predicted O-methyltransferase YrrM